MVSHASNSRVVPTPTTTGGTARRILVAVDFGTTYSAVAWLHTRPNALASNQQPQTTVVDEWPSKSDTQDKVPTTLQYDDGDEIPSKWGFETEEDLTERKYEWFKLELDPKLRASLGRQYPKTTLPPRNEAHVEKLVTDYLQALRVHSEGRIRSSFAGLDTLLKGVAWEYIITVPAVWPEAAQHTTRRCAEKAGMASTRPVQIIAEPEAAGIYALEHMSREVDLSVDDTFVICDAGGGTVDLISYTIKAIRSTESPVTYLEESAPGTGDLCGSTFLDRRFDAWLRRKFSGYSLWDDGYHADALDRWTTEIKRNFTGDVKKKFHIPARGLPDNHELGIQGGKFWILGKEVKDLFEPVMMDILGLVESQTAETKRRGRLVKAVLLAGGFGRNEYLKKRIQAEVGSRVKVERMRDCTTAIVRGALIRGLAHRNPKLPNIVVESRIARKHYGTSALTEYDPSSHNPMKHRVTGGVNGKDRIEVMQWFIIKGSKVDEARPASFKYFYDMSLADTKQNGGKFDKIDLTVFTCDEDDRPVYPDPQKNKELVKLTADLNSIPKETLTTQRGLDGEMYYNIPFQIEVTCHSADISFALVHRGIKYGSVKAQYM